jgi:2-C-methyl-D-erythritol 4-phosphate cytidylyltransferase
LKKFAVLVAGGQGSRMGHEVPKQFLPLNGKPILLHTLEKFSGIADEIVVVLPDSHIAYWKELCLGFENPVSHKIVAGGETRSASVLNGLNSLEDDGLVVIHDAVRPLVSKALIQTVFSAALIHGSAIPVTPIRESLRMKRDSVSIPVERDEFLAVQTPQCFMISKLQEAYSLTNGAAFTDDATVYGNAGYSIHTIPGEHANIKITYREDLLFATALTS